MKNILICTLFAALLASCKNNANEPKNDVTLAGRIELVDSNGIMLPNLAGAIVTVNNPNLTTVTDSIGHWEIHNVPEGEHDVTAGKSGFGTFHWYQQTFASGEYDLQMVVLANMPNIIPTLTFAGLGADSGSIFLRGQLANLGQPVTLQGYIDLDSTTQPGDSHILIAPNDVEADGGYDSTFYFGFTSNVLQSAGIHSGQTVYLSASTIYVDESGAFIADDRYFDPVNDNWQFASTGPKSNVLKVVIP